MGKNMLNLAELQEVLADVPAGRLVVGLFIHFANISQDEWMDTLARHLREAGIVTVGIVTPRSRSACHLEEPDIVAMVESGDLASLRGIDVFIISDMDHSSAHFPQDCPVIGCSHNSFVNPDDGLPHCISFSALMDAWLMPAPLTEVARSKIASLWSGMVCAPASRRQGKFFHIIPVGSLRLAALKEKMQSPPDKDLLVYAPMNCNFEPERGGRRLYEHGIRIIATLLAAFPHIKIIFRPYKDDLEKDEVRHICAEFAANGRFSLDMESGRAASFSRAAVLLTDFSHVGSSFNLAAGRPAIYFEPWQNTGSGLEKCDGNFWCDTYDGLIDAVGQCFASLESLSNEIRAKMDTRSLPVAGVFGQVGQIASDLSRGTTRDEWLTVRRLEDLPDDDEELRLVQRILGQPGNCVADMAIAAAVYANPGSPLLAALALHQCLVSRPEALFFQPFRMVVENHIKSERPLYRYKHAGTASVRRLYEVALAYALRKRDMPRRQFIESMLDTVSILGAGYR